MKSATKLFGIVAAVSALAFTSCNNKNAQDADKSAEVNTEEEAAEVNLPAGSMVYFNIDKVVEEYDMASDKRSEVEAKVNTIQKEIDRRQKNLENAVADFNNKINKGLITSAVANETQKKLQQQEATFQQFAQQKQAEIMEEQQVMINQIMESIRVYVEKYNVEKGFSFIFANQAGFPIVVADSNFDITADIIKGLNAEYVSQKKAANEDAN